MIVDVRDLEQREGHLAATDVTTVDDPLIGETRVPCTVEIDYRQSGGSVHLHAVVEGTIATECQRCLAPVRQTVRGDFDLMVRRGDPAGDGGDGVVVLPTSRHEIELDPYIHETVVVNMPMTIVCREECRGLCPICGADRNREPCECEAPADGRWDGLKGFR